MFSRKWLSCGGLAAALIVAVFGQVKAAVQKGPYLLYGGVNTTMTVLWQLDSTQSCSIRWGTDLTYATGQAGTEESGSGIYGHQHTYTITGLAPGTKYFYMAECDLDMVGKGSFTAAPPGDAKSVKLMAYGDTRRYPADFDAVNAQMLNTIFLDQRYQTITLHTGDWVTRGSFEIDWATEVFNLLYTNTMEFMASMPINGCIGNHEGVGDLFYKYFPYPYKPGGFYWSFDYGPVHIAVIDQYVDYRPGSAQYTWLSNDLAASTRKWKILVFHEPGWSAGGVHGNNADVQKYIQPLALKNGVDMMLSGNNHYYARAVVEGIQHITTGGGGAPLYQPEPYSEYVVTAAMAHHFCEIEIQQNDLYFKARDKDGSVLDSFRLTEPIGRKARIAGVNAAVKLLLLR